MKGDRRCSEDLEKFSPILEPRHPNRKAVARAYAQGVAWMKRSLRSMTPTPYAIPARSRIEPRCCFQMGLERSQRRGLADRAGKEPGTSSQKTSRELGRTPQMKLKILHFALTIQVQEQLETSNDKLQEIYG